jgi:molybdopterin molybdotransferase
MITLSEARETIDRAVKPLSATKTPLVDAVGCSLASSIKAPINVPGFTSSIMDGIAVRFDDLTDDGPWKLPIQAVVPAGESSAELLSPSHAVKIMTGAALISGADTVIKIEDVGINNGNVHIKDKTSRGNFVRPLGDDIQAGELLYEAGAVLKPIDIGVLASIGLDEVDVIPRPKIALLSTGSEIVPPTGKLKLGQRYDSNLSVLRSLLRLHHMSAETPSQAIPDEPGMLEAYLKRYCEKCDLVITSGGVSMGDFDFIPDIVGRLGGQILFHKVKVKPGKPVLIARVSNSWLVGLPGNPVSVVAGYHLHVRRIISHLMGQAFTPHSVTAVLEDSIQFAGNRFGMIGARLEAKSDRISAYPSLRQNSGRLSSVKDIDGFIMLEENRRLLAGGEPVEVELLY